MIDPDRSPAISQPFLLRVTSALALLGTTSAALAGTLRHSSLPHTGGDWMPAIPGVLVPLILPHVGAAVRCVLTTDNAAVQAPSDASDITSPQRRAETSDKRAGTSERCAVAFDRCADLATGHPQALLAENAALRRELSALRAAYDALQRDVAERSATFRRLDHMAHHDELTNLPNRALVMQRVNQALAFAKRAGSGVLFIYLDLDGFKGVNDGFGHAAGDRVLAETAARLAACVRGADTAGRLGGDEFVLICSTTDAVTDAPRVAERILAAISAPINLDGTTVHIGASMGISSFPADVSDPQTLIERADAAMYRAKHRGTNGYYIYGRDTNVGVDRRHKPAAAQRPQTLTSDEARTPVPPGAVPPNKRDFA